MNSPLKNLVREVIKTASQVEVHSVCEYEHIVLFSIAGPLAGLR